MRCAAVKPPSCRIGVDLAERQTRPRHEILIGENPRDHIAIIAEADPELRGLVQIIFFNPATDHAEPTIIVGAAIAHRETVAGRQCIPDRTPVRSDRRQGCRGKNVCLGFLYQRLDRRVIERRRLPGMGHAGNNAAIAVDIVELVERGEQPVGMSRIATEVARAQDRRVQGR